MEEEDVWRAVLNWAKYQAGVTQPTAHWTEEERARVCQQLSYVINHVRLLLIGKLNPDNWFLSLTYYIKKQHRFPSICWRSRTYRSSPNGAQFRKIPPCSIAKQILWIIWRSEIKATCVPPFVLRVPDYWSRQEPLSKDSKCLVWASEAGLEAHLQSQ